jgi:putative ABC transport system substrate-binding protein
VKELKMRKTALAIMFGSLLFCHTSQVEAQKTYRVGALVAEDLFLASFEGFKKKMAELGYVEGNNIKYYLHNAKGEHEALKKMAAQLVKDKNDVIVTSSTTATVPVAKETAGTNIPVVFLSDGNPLRFVKSYASSGNNLTGISSSSLDLVEKRLELLKELTPTIKRMIFIINPRGENYEAYLRSTREAAKRLSLELTDLEIPAESGEDVKQKLRLITRKLGEAILVPPDVPFVAVTEDIVQQAIKERLPIVGPNVQTVRRGQLAGYSSDYYSLGQQGAVLVDKIFNGAKPTDLPVEQPFRLSLVINLKTAKAMGLKIPKDILLRADEVIE